MGDKEKGGGEPEVWKGEWFWKRVDEKIFVPESFKNDIVSLLKPEMGVSGKETGLHNWMWVKTGMSL